MSSNHPPNPFARPSPWGNRPATRISLDRRPSAGAPPEPVAREQRTYASPATVSGFSAPPPRPGPRVARPSAPVAEPDTFMFAKDAAPEDVGPEVAAFVATPEPSLAFQPAPTHLARRRIRRDAPMAAYVLGGTAAVAVVSLGLAAALLIRRPVETPATPPPPASSPMPTPTPAVQAPQLVAAAPAPAPNRPAAPSSPTLRPVVPAPKSRPAEAIAVRTRPPAPVVVPASTGPAPLLDLRPVQAAPSPPQLAPAPVVRPLADPEAPIPTRSRTPD